MIAVTCGDPAGIGLEVIAAWAAAEPGLASETAFIGPATWLEKLPGRKLVVGDESYRARPGQPDGEGALLAWAALERAADGCVQGEFEAVVTGPVSKEQLAAIGWPHAGQTEFFASKWAPGVPPARSATMGFCGGTLRMVLLTWHIPLREVPRHLNEETFARTVAAADFLARRAGAISGSPRIAVCGLNPHAGEGGLIGAEERDLIDPILDRLRRRHPGLSRTLPGDTVFARQARGEFDVAIALYHDQGLAPLKLVDFDTAVNVTLGLPHVRTSPDHGTAFALAGRGEAKWTSLANAVAWARRLALK